MILDRDGIAQALPNYEIGDELGRGAWGIVLAGTHRELHRPVAVKVLPSGFGADPEVRTRFQEEARLLASLNHPHVVQVYDYADREGVCVVVMERLDGGTLWNRFATNGLVVEQSCAAALAASDALHHAHKVGVLHRDVKPENVMFGSDGTLKVTDFGIAKMLGGGRGMSTVAGVVLGTPAYMSPEQASGKDLTVASDVYALGVMLYELVAGRLPFPPSEDVAATLRGMVTLDPRPLAEVAPRVPTELSELVMKALARDPEHRYSSALDFGKAIARTGNGLWGVGWTTRSGLNVMLSGAIAESLAQPAPVRTVGPAAATVQVRPPPGAPEDRPSQAVPAEISAADLIPADQFVSVAAPKTPKEKRSGQPGLRKALLAGGAVLAALVVAVVLVSLLGGPEDSEFVPPAEYEEFRVVSDDSGTLEVEAPVEWEDVDGSPGENGPSLTAAPDVDAFRDDAPDQPGLVLQVAPEGISIEEAIAREGAEHAAECEPSGTNTYARGGLTGASLNFDCPGLATVGVVGATPDGGGPTLTLVVEGVSEADAEALLRALATFTFTGGG